MRNFTCHVCGVRCKTHTTEEERDKEFKKIYGENVSDVEEELVSLCDSCFDSIKQRLRNLGRNI